MIRSIRLNGDLHSKLIEVQEYIKNSHHLDLSLNYIINHLIKEGIKSAPLLDGLNAKKNK